MLIQKMKKGTITRFKFPKYAGLVICVIGILMLFISCSSQLATTTSPQTAVTETGARADMVTITDMLGRTVEIPTKVNTVYCAVPTSEAMIYSLAPEKMAAWVNKYSDDVVNLLGGRAKELPVLGGWMGEKVTANLEQIAKIGPDIIVWTSTIVTTGNTADSITQQTQCPCIILDGNFEPAPKVYRMMGEILGIPERGEKLASYYQNAMDEVSAMVAKIPENKKVRVYYAEGAGGLTTNPSGSGHTQVLDFVKGINVADVEDKPGAAAAPVSMEQMLSWDPDVIIVSSSSGGSDNYNTILNDAAWSPIKAVKNKKVYVTPNLPFPWFDRPPGVMRSLGIYWCGNLLYPEYVDIDIRQKTREFCSLFYNINLTDGQLDLILKNAER